jgi:hypothetical protein
MELVNANPNIIVNSEMLLINEINKLMVIVKINKYFNSISPSIITKGIKTIELSIITFLIAHKFKIKILISHFKLNKNLKRYLKII